MRADVPLLVFIGRLDYQKGVDLIMDNADWLLGEHDVQVQPPCPSQMQPPD